MTYGELFQISNLLLTDQKYFVNFFSNKKFASHSVPNIHKCPPGKKRKKNPHECHFISEQFFIPWNFSSSILHSFHSSEMPLKYNAYNLSFFELLQWTFHDLLYLSWKWKFLERLFFISEQNWCIVVNPILNKYLLNTFMSIRNTFGCE